MIPVIPTAIPRKHCLSLFVWFIADPGIRKIASGAANKEMVAAAGEIAEESGEEEWGKEGATVLELDLEEEAVFLVPSRYKSE